MKLILFFLCSLSFLNCSYATVDAHDHAYIVVKNIQSDEFFVERVPIIGCYGLPKGPQLIQFTSEYKATSNIGCGGTPQYVNINYLTCARVLKAIESDDFLGFKEIWLDISSCADRYNQKLISNIKTAARLNFPLKRGKLKLVIIKEAK
ncbi:MAG: hypothetical protein ACXVCP_14150 [Bdellovibrio sp.]